MVKDIWSTQMQNFKVGDWVISSRYPKSPTIKIPDKHAIDTQIFGTYTSSRGQAHLLYAHECRQWQPTEGEWCWFFNDTTDVPTLAKLIEITTLFGRDKTYNVKTPSCISETSYSYSRTMSFKHCEPFIGQLPTFIKDNT